MPSAAPRASAIAVGRGLLVGVDRGAAALGGAGAGALASRARSSVTRTDQPPLGGGAGEAAAVGVVVGQQQRAAVALGQRAVLEQRERLVGQVEQAQQVRDRDAAAADAPADLLAREAELLDEAPRRRAPPRPG